MALPQSGGRYRKPGRACWRDRRGWRRPASLEWPRGDLGRQVPVQWPRAPGSRVSVEWPSAAESVGTREAGEWSEFQVPSGQVAHSHVADPVSA